MPPMAKLQTRDRAAAVITDILQIVTHALASWFDHGPADLAGVRAEIEARLRDEIGAAP